MQWEPWTLLCKEKFADRNTRESYLKGPSGAHPSLFLFEEKVGYLKILHLADGSILKIKVCIDST